jgi:hypothetical protein
MKFQDFFCEEDITVNNVDIINFWVEVGEKRDALGEKAFSNLSEFAFRSLSLPISNASVERVFSILNSVKSKVRNKLAFRMLNSIVKIRSFMSARKICCNTFTPLPQMYVLHNSSMYNKKDDDQDKIYESEEDDGKNNNFEMIDEIFDSLCDEEHEAE